MSNLNFVVLFLFFLAVWLITSVYVTIYLLYILYGNNLLEILLQIQDNQIFTGTPDL